VVDVGNWVEEGSEVHLEGESDRFFLSGTTLTTTTSCDQLYVFCLRRGIRDRRRPGPDH
jgi:hypothetical protein